MKCLFCGKIKSAVFFVVALLAAYFINVEVQSYFGRQALAGTGLESVAFEDALAKAGNDGKLVLVDVSAIWCSTCRKLDNTVFSDDSVKAAINEKYVFSRIEYESEEGQRFLERYNASGFPTLFVIRPDGSIVRRLKVTFSPEEFRSQL
ncbi:MAG TPA: thioredoxin family protein [Pyrinomonadaceae bacterium]|mgnify:FL=1|nr:thioredoxin family protein [Pyrinomonadaceae bacterium]